MNTYERQTIRQGVLRCGFKRIQATEMEEPNGPYDETWEHGDGTQIVMKWTPKSDPGTPSI